MSDSTPDSRRHKAEAYHALAACRGWEWLGTHVPTALQKTLWKCSNGHIIEKNFNNVQRGQGCPHCYGNTPKTAEDYHALAQKRGFEWLGEHPVGVSRPTKWRCAAGHIWEASYGNIDGRGSGCPKCAAVQVGLKKRLMPEDYHALAQSKNLKWLGKTIVPTNRRTLWECRQGHQWETSYNSVINSGCPYCAGLARKTKADYYALATAAGIKWIGDLPQRTKFRTAWQCHRGHIWQAAFDNILKGTRCPICKDMVNGTPVSGPQRRICEILDGELNYPCGKYRIDVALPDIHIAIEYDGWRWHENKPEHDRQRDKALIEAGWRVLRIKSGEYIPTQTQLKEAIALLMTGETYTEIILKDWKGNR